MKSEFAKYWREKDFTKDDLEYFDSLTDDYILTEREKDDKTNTKLRISEKG